MDFSQIYGDYKHKIYTYVYYRVDGNKDTAEDVVSDVFVKAYRNFDRYDAHYAVSTWLYTIARNTLIDYYRKRKDTVMLDELEIADTTDPLYVLLNQQISSEELMDAIATLSPREREYIERQFLKGETAREIAEQEGVTHAAVRKQVSRGIAALREKLLAGFVFIGTLFEL